MFPLILRPVSLLDKSNKVGQKVYFYVRYETYRYSILRTYSQPSSKFSFFDSLQSPFFLLNYKCSYLGQFSANIPYSIPRGSVLVLFGRNRCKSSGGLDTASGENILKELAQILFRRKRRKSPGRS